MDGSRIRKENLRIQKNLDTRGRVLRRRLVKIEFILYQRNLQLSRCLQAVDWFKKRAQTDYVTPVENIEN